MQHLSSHLLQITIGSFDNQINEFDQRIEQAKMQIGALAEAQQAMLCSKSILEDKLAEFLAKEAVAVASEPHPELPLFDNVVSFKRDLDDDLNEPLPRTCALNEETCESCQ